jgi:hypothetical protein
MIILYVCIIQPIYITVSTTFLKVTKVYRPRNIGAILSIQSITEITEKYTYLTIKHFLFFINITYIFFYK